MKPRTVAVVAAFCCLLVAADYVWLAHLGSTASFAAHTSYYDQLTSAFLHGHLYFDAEPDPALLALQDPYDPEQRTGVSFPLDVSLYRGKYYLYFGPVPSLLLVIVKPFAAAPIEDGQLVLPFSLGLFVFQALLILRLWRRFFSSRSPWLAAAALLFAGLAAPSSYVVGKPDVYSAAIAAGQFFLLAGLYVLVDDLGSERASRWGFALAGLLWAAALGCRITLILPVGLMTIVILIAELSKSRELTRSSTAIPAIGALLLVMGAGVGGLAWYDWARFGSPTETGITYQLAGPNLEANRAYFFSPSYVPQNLYNYLINPPTWTGGFPFLHSATGQSKTIIRRLALPDFYHASRITGVLYTSPLLLLGLVPGIEALRRRARDVPPVALRWTLLVLYTCFGSGLVFFLVFFWAAERYLVDFLPCLVLLSAIGSWQVEQDLESKPLSRRLYLLAMIALTVISSAVSNLLVLGTIPLKY